MAEQQAAEAATPMDTAPNMADSTAAAAGGGGGEEAPPSSSAPVEPPVDPVVAAEQARLQEAHDVEMINLAREVSEACFTLLRSQSATWTQVCHTG